MGSDVSEAWRLADIVLLISGTRDQGCSLLTTFLLWRITPQWPRGQELWRGECQWGRELLKYLISCPWLKYIWKKPMEQNVSTVQRAVWSTHLWWYIDDMCKTCAVNRVLKDPKGTEAKSGLGFFWYAISRFWNSRLLSNEVLWLWTAFRTAWFMVPCVSFWQITTSADHTFPFFEMRSKMHVWTCAVIRVIINDCNRRSLNSDFGLKFFSLQIKHVNCLMLTLLHAVALFSALLLRKSRRKRQCWVLATAYLQRYMFKLSLCPCPFTVLLICGSHSEKPPLSLGT